MNDKKKIIINLCASIFSFLVSVGISFFVTPFVVEKLGDEAYGFITLANNFVSYASIVTVALNSMAGRFISIAIHKNDNETAQKYFSSVYVANGIISLVLAIISLIVVLNLKSLINVSNELYFDVQITFAISFLNFIISVITSIFTVATFVTNELHLTSIRNIISNFIKVMIIFPLFLFLPPKIYFICLAALISTIFVAISNYYLSKKLIPYLKIRSAYFSFDKVKELIASGVWNSISNLANIILTGLDLLIANIFISPYAMGILSVSKTVPTAILSFLGSIGGIFTPQFTILYAKNDIKGLVKEVKFSIKFFSLIMTVPLAGFIAFGTDFYSLWLPSKSAAEIVKVQILSILTIAPNLISSYIYSLYSVNIVTNKIKIPVLVTLTISILSTITVIALLKTTDLGVYAIAGVSSIMLLLRIIFFVPTYAAHNLKIKLTTFYKPLLVALFTFLILLGLFYIVENLVTIESWTRLFLVSGIVGSIGYIISFSIILNRKEKLRMKSMIISKIRKNKEREICE